MHKFFITQDQIEKNTAKILGEDVKHIANVLRLKKSDNIIICNKDTNYSYEAKINEIAKEYIMCDIIKIIDKTVESNVSVDIYQGLPKMDKMEYIIQKATELGVKNIYPVSMERCIVKTDKKSEMKKIERWNKIAEAAAKQSKRDFIPKVENIINIENICKNAKKYDIIIVAYENENKNTLKTVLKKLNVQNKLNIGVVIGPEGGIAEDEIEELSKAEAQIASLGNRILRTETASLVVLSDIIYEFEL